MHEKKFSIILPSYKEAENLSLLLPRLLQISDKNLVSYEIIIIDTHESLDGTQEVCNKNEVLYVNRFPGNSYGDAVRTGIKYARGEYIIFMDSDGSHPPEFLPELIRDVDHNDLIIASRYIKGGFTENNILQVWMSKMLNLIYSFVLNVKCKDISNSFRVYRAKQLKSLTLKCENFDIIQEILFSLIKQHPGFRIQEVPFSFKKRIYGSSKRSLIIFVLSYFRTLIKMLIKYRLSNKA